jgi:hypothetical protein
MSFTGINEGEYDILSFSETLNGMTASEFEALKDVVENSGNYDLYLQSLIDANSVDIDALEEKTETNAVDIDALEEKTEFIDVNNNDKTTLASDLKINTDKQIEWNDETYIAKDAENNRVIISNSLEVTGNTLIVGSVNIRDAISDANGDINNLQNEISSLKDDRDNMKDDIDDNYDDLKDMIKNGYSETSSSVFDEFGIEIPGTTTNYDGLKDLNQRVNANTGLISANTAVDVAQQVNISGNSAAIATQAGLIAANSGSIALNSGLIETLEQKTQFQSSIALKTRFVNEVAISNGISDLVILAPSLDNLKGTIQCDTISATDSLNTGSAVINNTLYVTDTSQFHNDVSLLSNAKLIGTTVKLDTLERNSASLESEIVSNNEISILGLPVKTSINLLQTRVTSLELGNITPNGFINQFL